MLLSKIPATWNWSHISLVSFLRIRSLSPRKTDWECTCTSSRVSKSYHCHGLCVHTHLMLHDEQLNWLCVLQFVWWLQRELLLPRRTSTSPSTPRPSPSTTWRSFAWWDPWSPEVWSLRPSLGDTTTMSSPLRALTTWDSTLLFLLRSSLPPLPVPSSERSLRDPRDPSVRLAVTSSLNTRSARDLPERVTEAKYVHTSHVIFWAY